MICTLNYESSISVLKCEITFLSPMPVISARGFFLRFPGFVPLSSYKTGCKMKTNVELRWNDADNVKPTYNVLGTKPVPVTFCPTLNPTWTISGSKSGHRLQKLVLISV
jgi:hypothetical protein